MTKPHALLKLAKYSVAQDAGVVKLNQNESPFDVPTGIKRKAMKQLARLGWNRYPRQRPADLIGSIAAYARVKPENIVIGNSSNEMIQAVIQTACVRGDKLVTVAPGFAVYPRVGRIMGLRVQEVELGRDFEFDVRKLIRAAKNAQLIMIASPNSPTGTVLPAREIGMLLNNVQCWVAIDEAYYEFHLKTALSFLEKFENLIIIRTLSKAFSLAGARLGYLIARPGIAEAVESVRLPFSVGWFAQIAGAEALRQNDYVQAFVARIIAERERVSFELAKYDCIRPVPSKTNFILFEIKGEKAHRVFNALYDRGVLVRPYDAKRLRNYLRVTIGSKKENDAFLRALKAVMEGK